MITSTTRQLRDYLELIETWEPRPDSTPTEAYTVLRAAADFRTMADDLVRSAVADVRSIPAHGLKITPDTRPGADSRSVVEEPAGDKDRSPARWSWAAIGKVLGVTAQAAQQRYGTPAATTYACVHCAGAELTLEGPDAHEQLNAWADEHVAQNHATEDRWPITFRVTYARNPGTPSVHYVRSPAYRG